MFRYNLEELNFHTIFSILDNYYNDNMLKSFKKNVNKTKNI